MSASDPTVTTANTTVQDELALILGAMLNAGLGPNRIANLLLRTGWRPPELPYMDGMELTRDR